MSASTAAGLSEPIDAPFGQRGSKDAETWLFDSDLEAVHEAATQVREFCADLGFGDVEIARIELCVYEAFVNAVEHAYGNRPGHEVRIMVDVDAARLRVRVCQRGVPLDAGLIAQTPTGFDDLPSGLDALDCESRGRGIRIIKAIMSSCRVEADGDYACLSMTTPRPETQS
ncbi:MULTISPECIES: ATP-binding protein [unclassified Thiocapsa]|uniref:ATP-binding protein n=1 Tax=unclassified Thiocapsa TaxID=2641286 RepID=UPI0035B43E0A